MAYYWPFADPRAPILQGPQALRAGTLGSEMAFRSQLTTLRQAWETILGGPARPSDGFFLINEVPSCASAGQLSAWISSGVRKCCQHDRPGDRPANTLRGQG